MAVTQKDRSAKASRKRVAVSEEELRLRVRPSSRQTLTDQREWSGITEQGEAITLMIQHLHALRPTKYQLLINSPRGCYELSKNMTRGFRNRSQLDIQKSPGKEFNELGH